MNPCILFIDPSHGSADRYLPRWNMANCYINCHCIEHRVRVEPRVHSGLERLGGTPGAPRGDTGGGGAGREAVLSPLASDRNHTSVSEIAKNNAFCCDFNTPRSAIAQSVAGESQPSLSAPAKKRLEEKVHAGGVVLTFRSPRGGKSVHDGIRSDVEITLCLSNPVRRHGVRVSVS